MVFEQGGDIVLGNEVDSVMISRVTVMITYITFCFLQQQLTL